MLVILDYVVSSIRLCGDISEW